jgi:hypothetical protein
MTTGKVTFAIKTLAARVRKLEARIEDLEDLVALNEAIARSNGKARLGRKSSARSSSPRVRFHKPATW